MNNSNKIIILGGRSLLAPFLFEKLSQEEADVTVVSRKVITTPASIKTLQLDLDNPKDWTPPEGATIISLLPLWVLTKHLDLFKECGAVIAIGSTSRFSKSGSKNREERKVVRWLEESEQSIQEWTRPGGPSTTLIRPTLIYDGQTDSNVNRIMKMINRLGFLPMATPANGKRQPIYAADAADAIIGAIGNKDAMNRAFNIAGGEILSYQDMVVRIFKKMGKEPRLFMMPMWFIKIAMNFIYGTRFLHKFDLNAEVFARMNQDLIFDNEAGLKVLKYNPRKFMQD